MNSENLSPSKCKNTISAVTCRISIGPASYYLDFSEKKNVNKNL